MITTQILCGLKSHKFFFGFHIKCLRFINFCVVFQKITQIFAQNICVVWVTQILCILHKITQISCVVSTIDLYFGLNHKIYNTCFGIAGQSWTSNLEIGSSNLSPVNIIFMFLCWSIDEKYAALKFMQSGKFEKQSMFREGRSDSTRQAGNTRSTPSQRHTVL